MFVRLAFQSLAARWLTVSLTVLAIAFSVALFLGVEKLRTGAKASFADTISGTDLIVGARSGSVQLLLYSVFRIGNATNNVTWESFEDIREMPGVEWAVPLSLGDSHKGYRVLGTTTEYFERYKYRAGRGLEFTAGSPFDDVFDAVLGADVAAALGYKLDDPIVVSHGIASFSHHDDKPFRVAGVLEKTGTPVDRTVIVSLEGIEAIHVDWAGGGRVPGAGLTADEARAMDLSPKAITAAMIGVSSKLKIFALQRAINEYVEEPLLAVLPGVALQELWAVVGVAETALLGVSAMVVATALLGMTAMIFAGLNERRREMAILRAVGAGPGLIMTLLVAEAAMIAAAGSGVGVLVLLTSLAALRSWLDAAYGVYISSLGLGMREAATLAAAIGAGAVAGLAPAARAYFMSLSDGMSVKT
ncbi:MAG: ABC transporter permease [Pseudomonadota bacterium]